ncbi:hypothetical protein WEU38_05695 [Cyanobacterium aponinum AL20118]|uniref:Uncharacterized protein n=2 Tax=Cyanobacterium aponinum TaxID=379064 RepID=A0A844GTR2_9CHRO|nr:hypothetical protein [Cyanobacterium aponinum]MTF38442.1 hypothetical protein [Cyanobacterium aponinum 0216]WPF89769.1 hypothetical protein SAY89_05715 [Cyanobacterium aponinum AL20115]
MTKIAYLDLEFKDKKNGDNRYKQPTELAYAWFSNKKYLNFKTFHFDYNQDIKLVLSELKKVIIDATKKYNFDTLIFWDYRQDLKILEQAGIDLKVFQIEDLQKNIAEIVNNNRLSLVYADKLFNLSDELIKETNYLKKENRLPLKLHTAVGDATRIAIIHREFYKHKEKYIHLIQEYLSHSYSENNPVEKHYKKEGSKKSILQNIPLNLEQIKRIKEGILLLLSLDKLTEEEKQLEEDFIKKNKNYLLVKKLEENNYDLANFTTELLKINRFLNLNFNISLKDLYEIDFSQLVNK